MAVPVQVTYNVSNGNGVTTSFACDFVVQLAGDLVVKVAGVTKTYPSDYTITNLGTTSNAIVVFGTAPANGVEVVRQRILPLARTAYDYQQSGDFLAAVVNADLDRLWMAMQQLDTANDFALRFPVTVSGFDFELPEPTADYALFCNADGDGFEWRSPGNVELAIPADGSVTPAKHANFTAYTILARGSGAGAPSLIPFTSLAATLASRAAAADVRSDLELGSAALRSMAQVCPTGAMWMFAMTSIPDGWLECNGAAVSRSTYSALFSAIGEVWGAGDGSTTFNLPDMRGEFARGWDHGRGVDSGRAFGSAQSEEVGPHDHDIAMDGDVNGLIPFSDTKCVSTASQTIAGGNTGTAQIANNTGTENRPRNKAIIYCIKT